MIVFYHANNSIFFIVPVPEIYFLANRVFPSGFCSKGFIYDNGMGAQVAKVDQEYMQEIGCAGRVEEWRDIAREALGGVGAS